MKKLFSRFILYYLRCFAKLKLKIIKPKIIGVTGSIGKTSAIHALHTIISPFYKTKTTFSGNSESGIPLDILNIDLKDYSASSWLKALVLAPFRVFNNEKYEILIAEMGVDSPDEPKNMSYLLKIIKPDIGVILNVAPVHTEQFGGNIETIAKEKGLLVTTMDKNNIAIINSDDTLLMKLKDKIKAQLKTFGSGSQNTLQIGKYSLNGFNSRFEFIVDGKTFVLEFKNQIFFEEYASIFAASILTASAIDISIKDAISYLEKKYQLPAGRLSIIPGVKNSTLIDSSYNASPKTVVAALSLLQNLKCSGKKIVVLGDMRELGKLAASSHKEIGNFALKSADYIILVGELMKKYAMLVIIESGFPKTKLFHFNKSKGVGDFIADKLLGNDDLILVKGSQNTIFLEQVVYELMKEKKHASELLCRQSDYWDRVREKFFSS
jgi:UDP-N-acetylmuramoyl-tripeptide--D-alanyl-D-alanine ligase